jgi:hypothetical protein
MDRSEIYILTKQLFSNKVKIHLNMPSAYLNMLSACMKDMIGSKCKHQDYHTKVLDAKEVGLPNPLIYN